MTPTDAVIEWLRQMPGYHYYWVDKASRMTEGDLVGDLRNELRYSGVLDTRSTLAEFMWATMLQEVDWDKVVDALKKDASERIP